MAEENSEKLSILQGRTSSAYDYGSVQDDADFTDDGEREFKEEGYRRDSPPRRPSPSSEREMLKSLLLRHEQDRDSPQVDLYASVSDSQIEVPNHQHQHRVEKFEFGTEYRPRRGDVHSRKERLLIRRAAREKKREQAMNRILMSDTDTTIQEDSLKRVAASIRCSEYRLTELVNFLKESTTIRGKVKLYTDVVQVKRELKYELQHMYIFSYGVVVFFNFSEEEESEFISEIMGFEAGSDESLLDEGEEMEYKIGEVFRVTNDVATLREGSSLELLSVAFAIAQCVKLNVFESRIEKVIEANKHLPESLARKGLISLTRKQMAQKIGELFIERNNINLHFDILDTPEYFWEVDDSFKHVYDRLFGYLELRKRVEILNKRLDLLHELFTMLSQQSETMHSAKLEWIVIFLVLMEVLVSLVWNILIKDILGFFPLS